MTILQRLDFLSRLCLPVGLTLVLVLLSVTPLHAPGFTAISPMLVLASLHYWAIYRPQVMPIYLVFVIGLFEDILTGGPSGLNALIYLVSYGLVAGQRRFLLARSFGIVWWGFMILAAAVEGFRWIVISALGGLVVDPMPGLFSYFASVAIYPVLTLLFAATHRLLPQPNEGVA